jgi:hypothetical protein
MNDLRVQLRGTAKNLPRGKEGEGKGPVTISAGAVGEAGQIQTRDEGRLSISNFHQISAFKKPHPRRVDAAEISCHWHHGVDSGALAAAVSALNDAQAGKSARANYQAEELGPQGMARTKCPGCRWCCSCRPTLHAPCTLETYTGLHTPLIAASIAWFLRRNEQHQHSAVRQHISSSNAGLHTQLDPAR